MKVMLVYLMTGGGHLAPAKTLAAHYAVHHPSVKTVLVNPLEGDSNIATFILEDMYRFSQGNALWLSEVTYALHKLSPVMKNTLDAFARITKSRLKTIIRRERPDRIVVLHFMPVLLINEIVKELKRSTPVLVLVTDPFSVHPGWCLGKQNTYILFSEKAKGYALINDIPEKNCAIFPYPYQARFNTPIDKRAKLALKHDYGLKHKHVVLLLGGADGIPRGRAILRRILPNVHADIVVVCGKNKHLYRTAMKLQKKHPNLHVHGFVDFIYELINAADVVITKAGANVIMEVLALHKIPIVTDYVWEQEKGNVEFIVSKGVGIYERKLSLLPQRINALLHDKKLRATYLRNNKRLNIQNGTKDVAEFILKNKEYKKT